VSFIGWLFSCLTISCFCVLPLFAPRGDLRRERRGTAHSLKFSVTVHIGGVWRAPEAAMTSQSLQESSFSPLELEFMAENELITICPLKSLSDSVPGGSADDGQFRFVCGNFGPFVAGVNAQVPLWLALTLKESKKARIILPEWMHLGALQEQLAKEKDISGAFSEMPFYYIEYAEMVLRMAEDDCAAACQADGCTLSDLLDVLRNLIEERETKILNGVFEALREEENSALGGVIMVTNISSMEVADLRDGFFKVRLWTVPVGFSMGPFF
jgi:hypothetical protein